MAEFAGALDRINELAEQSPGFVWRLTDGDGGSSSLVPVPGAEDPLMAPNLSVWTSVEALRDFMYRTDHVTYLRRRGDWFQHVEQPMTCGWWVPAGTTPSMADAMERLESLRAHGPTDFSWPLTQPRPQPRPQLAATEGVSVNKPLIPYLTVGDGRAALQFYEEVFGAEHTGELFEMDDGRIGHAELIVGGHQMYLADDFPEMNLVHPKGHGGPTSMALVIHVDDCDAVFDHAISAGATAERPPANQHGFRIGWFVDPWGHRWSPTGPEA